MNHTITAASASAATPRPAAEQATSFRSRKNLTLICLVSAAAWRSHSVYQAGSTPALRGTVHTMRLKEIDSVLAPTSAPTLQSTEAVSLAASKRQTLQKQIQRLLQALPELTPDIINEARNSLGNAAEVASFDATMGAIKTLQMYTVYDSNVDMADILARPIIEMLSNPNLENMLKKMAGSLAGAVLTDEVINKIFNASSIMLEKLVTDLVKDPQIQTEISNFITETLLTDTAIEKISTATAATIGKIATDLITNPQVQSATSKFINNISENPALLAAVNNLMTNAIDTGSDAVFNAWASPKFFGLLIATVVVAATAATATALAVLHCYQKACGGRNSLWSQAGTDVSESARRVLTEALSAAASPENLTFVSTVAGQVANAAVSAATSTENLTRLQQAVSDTTNAAVSAATSTENLDRLQLAAGRAVNGVIGAAATPANLQAVTALMENLAERHGLIMAHQGGTRHATVAVDTLVNNLRAAAFYPLHALMALLPTRLIGEHEDVGADAIPDREEFHDVIHQAEIAFNNLREVNEQVRANQAHLNERNV